MDGRSPYQQPQQTPLPPPPPPPPPPPTTPPPRLPSSGSAIQRILAGPLTLHEYRKLQSTPSPPVRSGKTIKRKVALDNLARRRAEKASPDAHLPARSPSPLQLQSRTYRENADSRPPNTGEAEEFYRSYLHSQGSNPYSSSAQGPPPTPASASESEISAYLSNLRFPQPPSSSPQERVPARPSQHPSPYSPHPASDPATPATVVHYRGASFDILNPGQSLSHSQVRPPVHRNKRRSKHLRSSAASSRSSANDMGSPSSGAGSAKSGRQYLPHRALFQDLPTAHSSITARSTKERSTPSPTPLDLKQKIPAMADLPLPPQPVAVQHHSQNYEASLPAEFVISMPPQLPAPSPTWKDKLGSAFTRKAPAVPQQLPTVKETVTSDSGGTGSVVGPRASAYLPPFKRTSNATQSVPYLTASTRQQDHHRTSSSTGHLSHHYYDDSSIYHNGSGGASSLAASSSRGEGSIPYGLDYSEEVGAQSHGYGFYDKNTEREVDPHRGYSGEAYLQERHGNEVATKPNKAPNRSTVGSIVKRYGDVEAGGIADFEEIGLDSEDEANADAHGKAASANKAKFYVNPGMQLFQLGRSILGTSTGASDPRKVGPSGLVLGKENHRFTAPTPPGQPPTAPLPPGPPVNYSLRASPNNRNTFSLGLPHDVSYGNTRNLLEISQNLSRGGLGNQSSGALTSGSAQASSCALGSFGDTDPNAAGARTSAPPFPASRPGVKENITNPDIERLRTEPNSPRLSVPHSISSSDKGLESDVYRELRRQSGLSNLSGNVFILSDDEIRMAQFNPGAGARTSAEDLGPGGSQSSSSHGQMSRDLSNVSGGSSADESLHGGVRQDFQTSGLWVERNHANATGEGSYTSSFQATNYSETSSQRDLLDGFGDENDGDWETVAESGAFSRFGTGRVDAGDDVDHVLPGSSIGDFSSHGSLNMERIKTNPFRATAQVIKHPADLRYEHVYRLRTVTPEGPAVLLPTYNFSGSAGFPNRNAMTPPLPKTSTPNKYQHPTPLSADHTHPFNSSPPEMPSRGVAPRTHDHLHDPSDSIHGSDKDSQAGHGTNRKHRHNTYGSSVRQYPSIGSEIGEEIGKGSSQGLKKTDDSLGELGVDGSYASSAWMNNFGEPGPVINSHELPGPNGSFAKVTVLGPRANVTGTPDGTGMREVGSSLAGDSSHAHWSSSPYPQGSSSPFRPTPLSKPSPPTSPEPAYSPRRFREQHPHRQQGHYNKQIRQHLEERKAIGLAEPAFYPAMPLHSTRMHTSIDGRLSPIGSISNSNFRATYLERPVSYNATPPLPHLWTAKQRQAIIDQRRKGNYRQHPRKLSSASTESYKRQGTISRAILITCILFPIIGWMMLLLLGYGCMDSTVAYCTNGEILKLRKREKSIAIAFSWAVIAVLIVGLIVASVVVAMEYH